MKTVVAIPFSREPDAAQLAGVMDRAGSTTLVCSLPAEAATPAVAGCEVFRTTHPNTPDGVVNLERVWHYMEHVVAPLAHFARYTADQVQAGDKVLFLHENIPASDSFQGVLAALNKNHFASVRPRSSTTPDGSVFYDYSDRCVAWRAGAFCRYLVKVPPPEGFHWNTSMEYVMSIMDDENAKHVWTDLDIEEL